MNDLDERVGYCLEEVVDELRREHEEARIAMVGPEPVYLICRKVPETVEQIAARFRLAGLRDFHMNLLSVKPESFWIIVEQEN